MLREHATPEENYEQFIEEARTRGEVWGLQSREAWAYCESAEYEETDVVVFWSDKADALQHIKEDWAQHVPVAIALEDFCEQWLEGMDADGLLVGPNWTTDLVGLEVEPSDLAVRLMGLDAEDEEED